MSPYRLSRGPRSARRLALELLESRIAPATVSPFNDVDGDLVTITISKVTGNDIIGAIFLSPGIGEGQHLVRLDLRDPKFEGVNVSITAKPDPANGGGDGTVNVGYIQANGRDLGTVFVEGDLGVFDAGNPGNPASACKGLTVHSLGQFGTSTGAPSLLGLIDGRLDKLTVKYDVRETVVDVRDSVGSNGTIGSVFVGGSVIGGSSVTIPGGQIFGRDGIGSVMIKGDLVGGAAATSGSITSEQRIANVTVGGSIIGGSGLSSGVIFSSVSSLGPVKIGHNIIGGSVANTGRVFGKTGIASVKVGGSLIGGAGIISTDSGEIHSHSAIGPVKIGHSVIGGRSAFSGVIQAARLGNVTLGGSLIGGGGADSGKIASGISIGLVKIGNDIEGGSGARSGSVEAATAIAGITLGGSVIGGGSQDAGSVYSKGIGGDGTIGPVKIAGDILAGTSVGTGRIYAKNALAGITLGGSVIGLLSFTSGAGALSAEIHSDGTMGPVKIAGNIIGGIFGDHGRVFAQKSLTSVTVGGSLIGGSAGATGEIMSRETLGPVRIDGNIVGGSLGGANGGSGYIEGQRITSVVIGGSVFAALQNSNNPHNARSGSIRAQSDIGSITIKGNLLGAADLDGDPSDGNFTPAVIAARGQPLNLLPAGAKNDVAINRITIGGRVEMAQILAGYTGSGIGIFAANADAQIGTVTVGGDWIASTLVAGVEDGPNNIFGDADDVKIPDPGLPFFKDTADQGGAGAISKIGAVVIKGRALGTADNTDLAIFGIEAQQIVSLQIAGITVAITAGAGNDLHASRRPISATFDAGGDFDFNAFEVPVAP